ncbi:MAG: sensor histidine kinase [Dehalococcoidia bacterium]
MRSHRAVRTPPRRYILPMLGGLAVYVAIAAAWFVASEWALREFVPDGRPLLEAGVRGLGFLLVTTVVLFLVLRRLLRALQRSGRRRRSLATEVRSRAADQRLLAQRLMQAEEEVRRAVAKDLHDGPLQSLTLSFMQLDAALREAESGAPMDRDRVGGAMEAIRNASEEIRAAVRALHPPLLAELGLRAAVERHCREVALRTDREVRFDADEGIPDLGAQPSIALFRIAQEALANAAKHTAPGALSVRLSCDEAAVAVEVVDGGPGFDPMTADGPGIGLVSMRERAESVGGAFEIDSSVDAGTTVRVRVPVAATPGVPLGPA